MEIPAYFKTKIASVFYTKPMALCALTEVADAEGGVRKVPGQAGPTFYGNIQPISAELRQSLLGQGIEADFKVTAPDTVIAKSGDLLQIGLGIYELADYKRYDSHVEMLARIWDQP